MVSPSGGTTLIDKGGSVSSMPMVCKVSVSSHRGASAEREEWGGGKGRKADIRKGGEKRGWGWQPGLPRGGPGA